MSVLSLIFLSVAGCGYFDSGSWRDNKQNWERAFHRSLPDGLEIVRSYYWKASHWSMEFEYFFFLRGTSSVRNSLFEGSRLMKMDRDSARTSTELFSSRKPSWFAPKTLDQYEIYVDPGSPHSNFRLFVDKDNNEFFITDSQI